MTRSLAWPWRMKRLGRAADAEQTYRRAIALRPRYWAGYSRLGAFYHLTGRDADAEQMFRQVVAILPDSWRGYSNVGAVYTQGKADEAIAAFEKSWVLKPNYQAASNLGTLYHLEKANYKQAATAFKRALGINANQFVVWGNYGSALHWAGDEPASKTAYSKAIELAEEARKTNPRDENTLISLANYHAALEHNDVARDLMEQVLAGNPESAATFLHAAEICDSNLHDRARALQLLERAISSGYPWKDVERSPSLAALRKDQRFLNLQRRVTSGGNAKGG